MMDQQRYILEKLNALEAQRRRHEAARSARDAGAEEISGRRSEPGHFRLARLRPLLPRFRLRASRRRAGGFVPGTHSGLEAPRPSA